MSIDSVTADLYDVDGVTHLVSLPNPSGCTWQHEVSAAGVGTFAVPLGDASTASIGDRQFVKLRWIRDGVVNDTFTCWIRSESNDLAKDGRRWLTFAAQPGALAVLDDARVYAEDYGPGRTPSSTRNFGFMSRDGAWRIAADWVVPQSVAWGLPIGVSRYDVRPPEFGPADPLAEWISFGTPGVSVPIDAVNYYRAHFTLAAATDINIIAAGDNFLDLYVDGEQVIAPDYTRAHGAWEAASQVPLRLAAGIHLFAASVANSVSIHVPPSYPNPIGFILTVQEIGSDGNPTGTILLRTNTTDWLVNSGVNEPGWTKAQIVKQCITEHLDRATAAGQTTALSALSLGFTDTEDSNGNSWVDRGQYQVDIGTVSLLTVVAQLSESDFDIGCDPETLVLHAWLRQGVDRSASVSLALGAGTTGDLKAYSTTKDTAKSTVVLAQHANGKYVEIIDPSAATTGRIETGLSLGSAASASTAVAMAAAQLAIDATPQYSSTGEASTLTGPVFGIDYFLGDTIAVPGHRNIGIIDARDLVETVDATGDVVRSWPETVFDSAVPVVGPTARFTAYATGWDLTVDASASTGPVSIASYAWDYGDTVTGSGVTPTIHTYPADGSFTITLTVTDTNGGTGLATYTITVAADRPSARFTSSTSLLAVTVDGSTSAAVSPATVASYAWNYGDGNTATGVTPATHTYASAGTYTVTLTITDSAAVTDTHTATVTVAGAGLPMLIGASPEDFDAFSAVIANPTGAKTGGVNTGLKIRRSYNTGLTPLFSASTAASDVARGVVSYWSCSGENVALVAAGDTASVARIAAWAASVPATHIVYATWWHECDLKNKGGTWTSAQMQAAQARIYDTVKANAANPANVLVGVLLTDYGYGYNNVSRNGGQYFPTSSAKFDFVGVDTYEFQRPPFTPTTTAYPSPNDPKSGSLGSQHTPDYLIGSAKTFAAANGKPLLVGEYSVHGFPAHTAYSDTVSRPHRLQAMADYLDTNGAVALCFYHSAAGGSGPWWLDSFNNFNTPSNRTVADPDTLAQIRTICSTH